MALPAVQSVSTGTRSQIAGDAVSCNVPKPTGLAAGDLMIADGTASSFAPSPVGSGWTLLSSGGSHFSTYWKIADASDVSASNIPFTAFSGLSSDESCTINVYRITGHDATTPINASHFSYGTSTASPTDTGITPTKLQSLFLMLVGGYKTSGNPTTSAYAVANNNPSWTEKKDTNSAGSSGTLACLAAGASASQTSSPGNATGTVSATISVSQDNTKIGIIAIQPAVTVSATPFVLASNAPAPSFVRRMVVTAFSLASTLLAPVFEATGTAWHTLDKSADTAFTNTPKS